LVERVVWDHEVAGSNPVAPIPYEDNSGSLVLLNPELLPTTEDTENTEDWQKSKDLAGAKPTLAEYAQRAGYPVAPTIRRFLDWSWQ
jgi:hypothetical protein